MSQMSSSIAHDYIQVRLKQLKFVYVKISVLRRA